MPRIQHTTVCCFHGLQEGIRLSTNPTILTSLQEQGIEDVYMYSNPERHIWVFVRKSVILASKSSKFKRVVPVVASFNDILR